MSSTLPTPAEDYAAPQAMRVDRAVWNAVFGSIGSRIRALEEVQADFEALIALGTGQALASIAANVEPELVAARAALTQLQADTALAQDIVAAIVSGSVPLSSVDGLVAALAAKATPGDITAAIEALEGGAATALDTLGKLATAIGGDASFASTMSSALAARLRVDAAQTLTSTQAIQGRANLGVGGKAPLWNRRLNGGSDICQDRATGATVVLSSSGYVQDGIALIISGGMALTCSQEAIATPGGSRHRTRAVVSTAKATLAASDIVAWEFPMIGIDVADLMFGTAEARDFCFRQGFKAPAGIYTVTFLNNDRTRSYVHGTVTVSAGEANTDTVIAGTAPGDTGGTWITDASGAGLRMRITLAAGTARQTATVGGWLAGEYCAVAAQSNAVATVGSIIDVFDGGLYPGTELPAWELPDYLDEWRRCSWLYRPVGAGWHGWEETETSFSMAFNFPDMRTIPSMVLISTAIVTRYAPVGDRTIDVTSIGALSATKYGAWVVFNCSGGNVGGRVIADRLGAHLFYADARLALS